MHHIPYNTNLKDFSRQLRNNSTLGEILLWNELKARKMMGYQFARQKPLGNFIVDFYCKVLNLAIEVDGDYHTIEEQVEADKNRQTILEPFDLNFSRFADLEVRKAMPQVLQKIKDYILKYEEAYPDVKEKTRLIKPPYS